MGFCHAADGILLTVQQTLARAASHSRVADGVVQLGPCASASLLPPFLNLMLPDGRLSHGSWMIEKCQDHLPSVVGELGILCINGSLRLFGGCDCQRSSEQYQIRRLSEGSDSGCAVWFGFGFALAAFIALAVFACVFFCFFNESRKTVIVPEPVYQKQIETDVQTSPLLYVELARGNQVPFDLVICIDSSCSVGAEGFRMSIEFAIKLIMELEMPLVQIGIIRFNHGFTVVSQMTGSKEQLLIHLQNLKYEPGETKLAPPLQCAGRMLQAGPATMNRRKQIVLVITDGDPNDSVQSQREASLLKNCGVLLAFIEVGRDLMPLISTLASPRSDKNSTFEVGALPLSLASPPMDSYSFHVETYEDLMHIAEQVLLSLVSVSQWVRRAKCSMDFHPYQVVPDLDAVKGLEVLVPGWEPSGPNELHWKPQVGTCIEDAQTCPWVALKGSGMPKDFFPPRPKQLNPDAAPNLMFPNVDIAPIFKTIFSEDNEPLPAESIEDNPAVNELIEVANKGEVFEFHDVRTGRDGKTYRRVLKSSGDGSFRAHVEAIYQGSDLMLPEGNYSRA